MATPEQQTVAHKRRESLFRRISSKLLRAPRAFFDDLSSDDDSSSSIWIVRYGVGCAHLFLFMTLAALILASLQTSSAGAWLAPNLAFNAIYTFCYASFLVLYCIYDAPSTPFVIGVALYCLGYALFAALFALLLLKDKNGGNGATTTTESILYVAASIAFLIGSIFLMHATVPLNVQVQGGVGLKKRFDPFRKSSALFWGSSSFFVGSIAFTIDSTLTISSVPLVPDVSFVLLLTGLAAFTTGRVFFLHGSTTDECDFLFRDSTA